MNSSLGKLVRNLWDSDFKHLTQEFDSENLKLLKGHFWKIFWEKNTW